MGHYMRGCVKIGLGGARKIEAAVALSANRILEAWIWGRDCSERSLTSESSSPRQFPSWVSSYSTLGGMTAYWRRSTRPSRSNCLSTALSVLGEMPGRPQRICVNLRTLPLSTASTCPDHLDSMQGNGRSRSPWPRRGSRSYIVTAHAQHCRGQAKLGRVEIPITR